jgi:hypothetical protein
MHWWLYEYEHMCIYIYTHTHKHTQISMISYLKEAHLKENTKYLKIGMCCINKESKCQNSITSQIKFRVTEQRQIFQISKLCHPL